jgi:hypothetical protein
MCAVNRIRGKNCEEQLFWRIGSKILISTLKFNLETSIQDPCPNCQQASKYVYDSSNHARE